MKSTDIPKILKNFYHSNLRTILIDGPWGSGKTYQVKEFLKSKKTKKTYYISLFGKESVAEINTELYNKIYPRRSFIKKSLGLGLSLINQTILPFKVDSLIDSLEFSLNDLNEKTFKNTKIIIFDDLERVSKKLSYTSLLGYVNSLHLNKIKVVFLSSSKHMGENQKKDYQDFYEKIIDRVYFINDTVVEIYHKYFNELSLLEIESIVTEFNNNIRIAQKSSYFYKEVIQHAKLKKYDIYSSMTPIELVRSCNMVVKLCFLKHEKPNIHKSNEIDLSYVIEYYKELYNENIANGLYEYFYNNNQDKNTTGQRLRIIIITSLLNAFLYDDYTDIDNLIAKENQEITPDNILEQVYFYLSDENKKIYEETMIKRLMNSEVKITKDEIEKYSNVLSDDSIEVSNEKMNVIVENMIKSFDNEIYELVSIFKINNRNNKLIDWINKIEGFNIKYSIIELKQLFCNNSNEIDYNKINNIFFETKYKEAMQHQKVKTFFLANKFFIPNIYGDIKNDEWKYMVEITKYAKENKIENDLKSVFTELYEKDPNNFSLKQRINSLTTKYFNE